MGGGGGAPPQRRKGSPIATLAVLVACGARLAAQDTAAVAATVPVIVTTGEAVVRRAPDVAFVMVAVESRAKSPRDAQRQNAEAMSTVRKRIADAGISKDALRTLGGSLDQEFDEANGRRTSRGFVARSSLEVRLDEMARAGEMVDAVVQAGATSLNGIRFDVRDRTAAERDAIRLAVIDARGRAEAAATGAGRSVDRILKIDDSRAGAVAPRPMAFARAEGVAVTGVEPGLIEIHAYVTLTVSMK